MQKIFVPLHQQSKEQPIVPKGGHNRRPGRGLNDGRRRSSMKTQKQNAFAISQYTDVMTIEKFAKHITSHDCMYSRADISAILYMAVDCMREMLLEGKNLFGNNKQSRVVNSITRTK